MAPISEMAGNHPQTADAPLSSLFDEALRQALAEPDAPIAFDPASRMLFKAASRVAPRASTVLLTGPSGAGKDVLARYLHRSGSRAAGQFIALNCAALPEAMLEALLFGHERGAFTGAQSSAPGLFRAADGGTLFLDELGEMPLAVQAKLLRVIEQREVLPLGATKAVSIDVRLVAATNCDLKGDVEAGRFRADLYWRLAVFPLELKPLAQRPGDIVPLAAAIMARLAARDGHAIPHPGEDVLARLMAHSWPGNVRELANALERALILAGDEPLRPEHFSFPPAAPTSSGHLPDLPNSRRNHERSRIDEVLAETGGRRAEAARRLGISERTLRYKLAALAGRPRGANSGLPAGAVLQ